MPSYIIIPSQTLQLFCAFVDVIAVALPFPTPNRPVN